MTNKQVNLIAASEITIDANNLYPGTYQIAL
jgi:hypothetical protein